jgi:hypothetical protein
VNKNLRLPIDIELRRHAGQGVLVLSFRREALRDWCLGLCLLKEGLIDTLTVAEEHGSAAVKIRVLDDPKVHGRTNANFRSDIGQLEVPRTSLEYLQAFFLKYYRDEVAEVDHVDLEAIDVNTGKQGEYVIFRVPDSKPPVSVSEAKKRFQGQ